jgi:hypothetical protein
VIVGVSVGVGVGVTGVLVGIGNGVLVGRFRRVGRGVTVGLRDAAVAVAVGGRGV